MGPIHVAVGASVAVVRAVDVATRNVVVLVHAAVRKDACSGQFPLAQQERFGWVGGIDGPNVACVVGVGAVLRCDQGEVSPVDAVNSIVRAGPALIIPSVHRVRFCCTVAQEMVVRNGVVNPPVAVEGPGASAPFFGRHVGVAAAVRAVPAVVCTRAPEPSTDLVVLWP